MYSNLPLMMPVAVRVSPASLATPKSVILAWPDLATKMFCGCPVEFGGEPNTRVCPVCLGMPGALPVPNKDAIEATVLAGLALDCDIALWSQFHRKQYFYPDIPKDYQITQYDLPFCSNGVLDVDIDGDLVSESHDHAGEKSYVTRVGITRIHLEEDAGKMIHVGGAEGRIAGADHSLADYNRAGTALIELVSEPDMRTPEEARRFAQKLRLIMLTLGVSDCNMEEGSMRADGNISIRLRGETELGVKAELKNMNSFKAMHDALAFEIIRQAEVLDAGGEVLQETRHWDVAAKCTSSLRSKEEAHDYRYFPEPDLLPVQLTEEWIERIAERLPELPNAKRERFMETWGLSKSDATTLCSDAAMATYFEAAMAGVADDRAGAIANIVLNEFSAHLNADGLTADESPVKPGMIAELVGLIDDGTISSKQAKKVFLQMAQTGDAPAAIVETLGIKQVSDSGAIEAVVDAVLAANPDEVAGYRAGKTALLGFFVGQVMREMRGQGNPKLINEVLRSKLS